MKKKEKKSAIKIGFMCTETVYSTTSNPVKVEVDLVFGEQ